MAEKLSQTGAQQGLAPTGNKTLSPSSTMDSSYEPSPNRTLTNLHGSPEGKAPELPATSTLGKAEVDDLAKGGDGFHTSKSAIALSSLPAGRKNILLLCFCLAMFIDAAGVSATFLMTAPIAKDLNIAFADEAWVLGTYSMVFAATLLFAGRLADLYPPHRIYTVGFIGIAIFYLVISFMENSIAFYVLRAFSALLAVLTIPSAINMIVQMYPEPAEQAKKLALFGMAGALANTIALVLAGVFLLASWRWYFRFITILIAPFAVLAWFMMPKTTAVAEDLPGSEKWKRMDLGGVAILVAALILFILSFTQAPIKGWNSAIFIAPFVVSLALFVVFFIYEAYLPRGYALLPQDIWSYPNLFPLMLQASSIFMWMACAQLRIATYFQVALGNSPILAAVKLLPMGITALIVGVGSQAAPWLITRPRYVQPVSSVLCFAGSMLFAYSGGGHGNDYWKFMFTGQVIGTAGGMIVFIGMNTSIIQSFPLEFAGVGGAFSQVLFQVGGVVGIAIQAGLIGTGDGTIEDWTGSKNSYFFTGGYILFTGLVFVLWYRQYKMPKHDGPVVAV